MPDNEGADALSTLAAPRSCTPGSTAGALPVLALPSSWPLPSSMYRSQKRNSAIPAVRHAPDSLKLSIRNSCFVLRKARHLAY